MNVEVPMGRPPKDPAKKRDKRVVLLFTQAELEEIEAYIEASGYDGNNDLGRSAVLGLVRSNKPSSKGDGE
jgi:hypothetical protein